MPDQTTTTSVTAQPGASGDPGTGTDAMIRLEGLTKSFPGQAVPAVDDLDLAVPTARSSCSSGPSGLRQDHDAEDDEPADRADQRAHPARRRATSPTSTPTAAPPHRLRHPAGRAVPALHDRRRTSRSCRRCWAGTRSGSTRARRRAARPRGLEPKRVPRPLPPPALGRAAAARRGGARPGRRPRRDADGRAVRRHRPDHPRPPAGRVPRASSARSRKTICFVTHDLTEAVKLGDRIAVFGPGGVLEQYDTPEQVLPNPANDFVAEFVGSGAAVRRLSLLELGRLRAEPWRGRGRGAGRRRARLRRRRRGAARGWVALPARRPATAGHGARRPAPSRRGRRHARRPHAARRGGRRGRPPHGRRALGRPRRRADARRAATCDAVSRPAASPSRRASRPRGLDRTVSSRR